MAVLYSDEHVVGLQEREVRFIKYYRMMVSNKVDESEGAGAGNNFEVAVYDLAKMQKSDGGEYLTHDL